MKERKPTLKDIPGLAKETFKAWINERPLDLSAIVSYYAIFALPGLLIILIAISGTVFGQAAVEGKIEKAMRELIGNNAGKGIQTIIANAHAKGDSAVSTFIGLVILMFSATGVFTALQRSLNKIWNARPNPRKKGLMKILITRLISFALILALGFLLLVSLILTSLLSIAADWLSGRLFGLSMNIIFLADLLLSYALVSTMFALIYKFLPDIKIRWKTIWIGAALSAFLFILGKSGISIFFNQTQPESPYGVAGFVILLILWISYSSMILFLGAEFIQVYTRRYVQPDEPDDLKWNRDVIVP